MSQTPSSLQRERNERGQAFQDEIRNSWADLGVSNWRLRLKDGGGDTRPADELVLLEDANILAEHKRTESDRFQLGFLRPDQFSGLILFDRCLKRNKGLVFVSFQNDKEGHIDEAYAFRLLEALDFMKVTGRRYITLSEFRMYQLRTVYLPRVEDNKYDLRGLVKECTSL